MQCNNFVHTGTRIPLENTSIKNERVLWAATPPSSQRLSSTGHTAGPGLGLGLGLGAGRWPGVQSTPLGDRCSGFPQKFGGFSGRSGGPFLPQQRTWILHMLGPHHPPRTLVLSAIPGVISLHGYQYQQYAFQINWKCKQQNRVSI
jgi:hypothetical protein